MKCEGACGRWKGHAGLVRKVHVSDPRTGTDWGFFDYCENAVDEDRGHGLTVVTVELGEVERCK